MLLWLILSKYIPKICYSQRFQHGINPQPMDTSIGLVACGMHQAISNRTQKQLQDFVRQNPKIKQPGQNESQQIKR
jgi:hypothetical protein